MDLLRRVITYPFIVANEFPARTKNWIQIRILRRHEKFVLYGLLPEAKDIAILAVFPGTTTFGSVIRVARWLEEAGYSLIIVINENPLSEAWVAKLHAPGRVLLARPNIGSDFGAYQLALKLIRSKKHSIQNLVIANDSMVYHPESHITVARVINIESQDICNSLFLNMQGVIHAPSMLLRFGREVLVQKDFWEFWEKYFPYISKRKIISKGEHTLTKVVGWKNITPVLSTSSLPGEIDLLTTEFLQLLRWSFLVDPILAEIAMLNHEKKIIHYLVEFAFENFHVSDSLGLYCARQLQAPLKLDLAKRGLVTKQAVLDAMKVQNLEDSELIELQRILENKESYTTKTLLQRLFRT